MTRKKIIRLFLILFFGGVPSSIIFCNYTIKKSAEGKLFSTVSSIPYRKVGLLLGTSKFNAQGGHNLYYEYRIEAAKNLIKNGKIKYLIISGDNGNKFYNEPEMMRKDLIDAGIDSSIIYLDYAGFRTFDSIIRLKKVFGQNVVTIISQENFIMNEHYLLLQKNRLMLLHLTQKMYIKVWG